MTPASDATVIGVLVVLAVGVALEDDRTRREPGKRECDHEQGMNVVNEIGSGAAVRRR